MSDIYNETTTKLQIFLKLFIKNYMIVHVCFIGLWIWVAISTLFTIGGNHRTVSAITIHSRLMINGLLIYLE